MAYSKDLKMKVMEYLQKGNSQRNAERVFGVNLSTVNEWHQKYQRTGSLENKPPIRKPKKIDPEKLKEYIAVHPDAYLTEIGEAFNCSESAIRKALKRLGITRKKRQSGTASKAPDK